MQQPETQNHNRLPLHRKMGGWCITHPMTAVALYVVAVSLFFLAFS